MAARISIALTISLSLLAQPGVALPQARLDGPTIVGGESALPQVGQGAPNYSPEQMASALCEARTNPRNVRFTGVLQDAYEATVAARNARRDHLQKRVSDRELERAEQRRQAAVRRVGTLTPDPLAGTVIDDLPLENVTYRRVIENGRPVLLVEGRMTNTSDEAIETPPLSLLALDVRGFLLAGQTTQTDFVQLKPGESRSFRVKFRNPPEYTAHLKMAFAPPFQVRLFRGCEFLNPMRYDPRTRQGEAPGERTRPVPVPAVGDPVPAYEPRELAAIARIAYADAMDAFEAAYRDPPQDACAPLQSWRELLILSERADDAFYATIAAQEVRRDAPRGVFTNDEVVDAELSRQRAIKALLAARPHSRPLAGNETLTRVANARSTPGFADEVVVHGRLDGRRPGAAPLGRVTVTDRFGFVVTDALRPLNGRGLGSFGVSLRLPTDVPLKVEMPLACWNPTIASREGAAPVAPLDEGRTRLDLSPRR